MKIIKDNHGHLLMPLTCTWNEKIISDLNVVDGLNQFKCKHRLPSDAASHQANKLILRSAWQWNTGQ